MGGSSGEYAAAAPGWQPCRVYEGYLGCKVLSVVEKVVNSQHLDVSNRRSTGNPVPAAAVIRRCER